ncbi:zinc ABC transporter substrate-binding protein [Spongiibacter sp. KMU-158]|uniref:High-affinity zinc uptake system protein ZnuA n=1 Tax=Spongiibacter pelagi TaxID=2760804 RepID=A0A927GV63_9GAMM|nr:zinc ABC transporter substrate-binding protein [Spongiibacter pelagi]MBD2857552.1 zinc ABC transporter substrate-binding protein [Spongiibacter pelagi]
MSAQSRLQVMSSILPLNLMVTEIGGDAVDASLLLPPSVSPHDYQFRPSDIRRMMGADVFFWVSPELENSLKKLAGKHAAAVSLAPNLARGEDPHVWLDLQLVQDMARKIANTLSRQIPTRGAYFHANAARFISDLRQYDKSLQAQLQHVPKFKYLLVHDGFSRFESHYGIGPGKVVMKSEHQLPGARHMASLREGLLAGEFTCVFKEPQFPMSRLASLLEGVESQVIELDLLGLKQPAGAYFVDFYQAVGSSYLKCAAAAGWSSSNWPAGPTRRNLLGGEEDLKRTVKLRS